MPFCTRAKPLELTSKPFCTRAKPPCKRSKTFCTRRKTVLQTFKTHLFMMQNRPANVQDPFVHDAKPSCKRSRPFCSWCKTVLQTFKGRLPMPPYRIEIKQTHLFILYLVKLKSFIRKFVHSFPVGAYRIRPDVSERATYSHKTPITKLEYKNGSIAKNTICKSKNGINLPDCSGIIKRENPVIIQDSLFFNGTFFNPNSPYNSLTLNKIHTSYCCC